MKTKKLLTMILILVLSVGCLTGCGSSGNDNESSNNTKGKTITVDPSSVPIKGDATGKIHLDDDQTLNLTFGSPNDIDVTMGGSRALLSEVDEGLIRVMSDKNGDYIVPAGAEKWDVSEDGKEYIFHLRKDNKWSDGVPVTAKDYVFSWLRLLDRSKGFDYSYLLFNLVNGEEYYNGKAKAEDVGVKAVDDYTLKVTLKEAAPYFLKQLIIISLFPIRQDVYEKGGEKWATDPSLQVYNGPFIIKEWVKGASMKLVKNPNYWDAKNVYLNNVNLSVVDEIPTQAQMFESKELDGVDAQLQYIDKWNNMAKEGKIQSVIAPYACTYFMAFNQKTGGPSGLMKNQKIRKAISMAIDREQLIDTVYGRYYPAYGLIPKGMQIGDKEFRSIVQEPIKDEYEKYKTNNKALQDLFREGLKELGINKDLSQIELTYIATGSTTTDKTLQEYFKQMFENKLGIKIKLNVLGDSKLLSDERNNGRYDIMFTGWFSDYDDPLDLLDLFPSDSGFSDYYGNYKSDKYDQLHEKLKGENDMAKRQQIYMELEKMLVSEDYVIAPVYYMDIRVFMQNYVKNMSTPMFGARFEYTRAYIDGKE